MMEKVLLSILWNPEACLKISKDLQVFIILQMLHKFLSSLNNLWLFVIHCCFLSYFFHLLSAPASAISRYFVCSSLNMYKFPALSIFAV